MGDTRTIDLGDDVDDYMPMVGYDEEAGPSEIIDDAMDLHTFDDEVQPSTSRVTKPVRHKQKRHAMNVHIFDDKTQPSMSRVIESEQQVKTSKLGYHPLDWYIDYESPYEREMRRRQEAKALCEARLESIAERIRQKRVARGELFAAHTHSQMTDEEEDATVPDDDERILDPEEIHSTLLERVPSNAADFTAISSPDGSGCYYCPVVSERDANAEQSPSTPRMSKGL